jgi:hypothetical protein
MKDARKNQVNNTPDTRLAVLAEKPKELEKIKLA